MREVIQVYFYKHNKSNLSQKDAVKDTVKQICEIWAKARVPISEPRNITRKFDTLLDRYRNICRNSKRKGSAQLAREVEFESSLTQLFDIAHHDAMNIIKIEEDRVFLADQRTDRKYVLGNVDKELHLKEVRKAVKIQQEIMRKVKEKERKETIAANVGNAANYLHELTDSDLEEEKDEEDVSSENEFWADCNQSASQHRKHAKTAATTVVSTDIAAALDRTNVSDRNAALVMFQSFLCL